MKYNPSGFSSMGQKITFMMYTSMVFAGGAILTAFIFIFGTYKLSSE